VKVQVGFSSTVSGFTRTSRGPCGASASFENPDPKSTSKSLVPDETLAAGSSFLEPWVKSPNSARRSADILMCAKQKTEEYREFRIASSRILLNVGFSLEK
jgi:hypothetical protein